MGKEICEERRRQEMKDNYISAVILTMCTQAYDIMFYPLYRWAVEHPNPAPNPGYYEAVVNPASLLPTILLLLNIAVIFAWTVNTYSEEEHDRTPA